MAIDVRWAALALVAVGLVAGPAPADAAGREGAMLSRPLFAPSRRPPPAPVPEGAPSDPPPPPPPAPPALALSGVIAGGGGGVALLRRPQDAAPVRVARGATLDGWTLSEVRARAVVLMRDGRSVTVELPSAGP